MIRVRVDNDGSEDWRGAILALESRDHPQDATKDTTAKLFYEAEDLTPMGGAAIATRTDASGGASNNVVRATLNTFWTAILGSEIAGVGHMTHKGPRRMWFRVYSPGSDAELVELRLESRALGSTRWTPGPIVSTPLIGGFALVDLGECRPQEAVLGSERWEWRLTARKTVSVATTLDVDLVFPLPTEQLAVVREPLDLATPTAITLADEFDQTAGALSGKALGIGAAFSGPRSGGTFVDDASIGTIAWSNPSNAGASDDSRAVATAPLGVEISHYLKATNFGFAIPAGATISGIKVEVEQSASQAGVSDNAVRIVKGGAIQATDRSTAGDWSLSDVYRTHGGEADLWGTTFTQADINSTGFGIALSAKWDAGESVSARIDHIRITVYYTPSGGEAWVRAGDTDDFAVEDTGHTAQRTAVSDAAGIENGCFEVAGSQVFTDCAWGVTTSTSASGSTGTARRGVAVRYADLSNFLLVDIQPSTGDLTITRRVTGNSVELFRRSFAKLKAPGPFTIVPLVTARGELAVFVDGEMLAAVKDSALATGGALASGKVTLWDHKTDAIAETRTYDAVSAWVPDLDAVGFAGRSIEFRTDGVYRQDPSADAWGRLVPDGFLPYAPPSWLEGRALRGILIGSQGDFEELADSGDNPSSLQITYHPGYHFASEGAV